MFVFSRLAQNPDPTMLILEIFHIAFSCLRLHLISFEAYFAAAWLSSQICFTINNFLFRRGPILFDIILDTIA